MLYLRLKYVKIKLYFLTKPREFLITGYPHHIESNSKSWNVEYTIDDEEVEDSYLVVSIYEGKYEKDEYTLYVS